MSSPGVAFVALSDRAWAANATARLPRSYWEFAAVRHELARAKPETPGTAPVHLILQVAEALRMIHEEGFADVVARHAAVAARTRAGVAELGLASPFPHLTRYSATLTPVALPPDVAPVAVRNALKVRGILIAAGLGKTVGHTIRIGHMGDIRMPDVERTLSALAEVLATAPSLHP
jgi:aspartate aminotransferase-like enzyme